MSRVPSYPNKSLLGLLDEHGGSSGEVLLWRIDLTLAPASTATPTEPLSAKVGGGVCLFDSFMLNMNNRRVL